MKSFISKFLFCFGLTGLLSCGGGGGGGSDSACNVLGAKIFNGESCNQNARSPVVALFPVASNGQQLSIVGICTATLVTLDDIVTSAHCFTEPIKRFRNEIVGFVVLVGGADGQALPIVSVKLHPLYNGEAASPYDIAMASISEVPNPAIGPVPIISSKLTAAGDDFTSFGYGTNNTGEIGELKAAEFNIDEAEGGNFSASSQGSNASICAGDSGGPAVEEVNGSAGIIGINSFGPIDGCVDSAASFSGFLNIQNPSILEFIKAYAPDVSEK